MIAHQAVFPFGFIQDLVLSFIVGHILLQPVHLTDVFADQLAEYLFVWV